MSIKIPFRLLLRLKLYYNQDRVTEYETNNWMYSALLLPRVCFLFFESFFVCLFPSSLRHGSRRTVLRSGPQRSPICIICMGVLRSRRVYSSWRRHPQLPVLDRGQLPSPRGPPRHHRTELEGRDPPVSGECPAPIQNQPVVQSISQTPVKPVSRRRHKPAVRGSEVMPAVIRGEVKSAVVRGSFKAAVHGEVRPAAVRRCGKPTGCSCGKPAVRGEVRPAIHGSLKHSAVRGSAVKPAGSSPGAPGFGPTPGIELSFLFCPYLVVPVFIS